MPTQGWAPGGGGGVAGTAAHPQLQQRKLRLLPAARPPPAALDRPGQLAGWTGMPRYTIDSIPGDGIGCEVVPAAIRCLDEVARLEGFDITWRERDWGSDSRGDPETTAA